MKAIEKIRFEKALKEHFDRINDLGLGELLLFSKDLPRFVEKESCRTRLLNRVVGICGWKTSAREFVRMVSYEDFRHRHHMSDMTVLGLKLFLFYVCGVDWEKPDAVVKIL